MWLNRGFGTLTQNALGQFVDRGNMGQFEYGVLLKNAKYFCGCKNTIGQFALEIDSLDCSTR